MTYEYECTTCKRRFDVIKPVRDMDVNEYCPACDEPAVRQFMPKRVYFSGTKVTFAEYNPGLGQVVNNAYERSEAAKRLGVVEVGNDYGSAENMQKAFDSAREEKLKKRYEDI